MSRIRVTTRKASPVSRSLFRLPDDFPLVNRLVHVAWRVRTTVRGSAFTYVSCLGVLANFQFRDWENADWNTWRVPDDTVVTCLTCLVRLGAT